MSRRPKPPGPPCGARTRTGERCRAYAMHGRKRCRMHGGASGSGAPKANRNALRTGLFTAEAIAERKQIEALLRATRLLLRDLG